MKMFTVIFFIGLLFQPGTSANNARLLQPSIVGVFEGRTPCQEIAQQFKIPAGQDCVKLKWRLTLYKNAATHAPTVYKLERILHRRSNIEGSWKITNGTRTNPSAIVYELSAGTSQAALYLLKADENVLFFLDKDKNLLVGNSEFSYTLNRKGAED